jgi:hypothetical protein
MALQIPKQHIPGLAKIKLLTDSAVDRLMSGFGSHPPIPDTDDAVKVLADLIPEIPPGDLANIVETLYVLYYVREFSEAGSSRFINDLIQALKSSKEPSFAVSDKDVAGLKERLNRLLSIENISLLSKALRLQREGEHLYCEAKIMSDIRPVFHDDISAKPAGGVVSHTLKLEYHKGPQHNEFFVILESADLQALKKTLERAIEKEVTLRKLLADSGLQDLGV